MMFPTPVSRLESVCTDTPLTRASRAYVMRSSFRRATRAKPISFLFIATNIIPLFGQERGLEMAEYSLCRVAWLH